MNDLRPGSQIADKVHWIKDGYVNAYIVENDTDLILIDTGFNRKAKKILDYIKSELEDRTIAKVLLTHHHLDHTRGGHYLQDHLHPTFYSSEIDSIYIEGRKRSPLPNNWLMKPLFFIIQPFLKAKPITDLQFVSDGDLIDGFTVSHLPGHTLGSMGFQSGEIMFAGDAISTDNKGSHVKLGPSTVTESMPQAKASLKKLGEKSFNMILPGHGTPILEDASLRVKDAIEEL